MTLRRVGHTLYWALKKYCMVAYNITLFMFYCKTLLVIEVGRVNIVIIDVLKEINCRCNYMQTF